MNSTKTKAYYPSSYPSVVSDLSDDEYHGNHTVFTSSRARTLITHTPAHIKHRLDNPIDTSAMAFGRYVHAMALTPGVLNRSFAVWSGADKRTKAGKAEWESFQSINVKKTIITADQHEVACVAAASVAKCFPALGVNDAAHFEASAYALIDGVASAARPDILVPLPNGGFHMVDLKTSRDLNTWKFLSSCNQYGYFTQLQHYREVLAACGYAVDQVSILAVENTAPFTARVFDIPIERCEQESSTLKRVRDIWKECNDTNTWPGWGDKVTELGDYL